MAHNRPHLARTAGTHTCECPCPDCWDATPRVCLCPDCRCHRSAT